MQTENMCCFSCSNNRLYISVLKMEYLQGCCIVLFFLYADCQLFICGILLFYPIWIKAWRGYFSASSNV